MCVCGVSGAVDRVRGSHFLSAVRSVCDVVDGAARRIVLSLDTLQRRTHRQSGRTHQPIRVGVAEAVQRGAVAVTPLTMDLTHSMTLRKLKGVVE